jgi:hypothetical protein
MVNVVIVGVNRNDFDHVLVATKAGWIGKCLIMKQRRPTRRMRIEQLESRAVLAAGTIPIDLTIPLDQLTGVGDLDLTGTLRIRMSATVLDPTADTPDDVSLTGYELISSGGFNGIVDGGRVNGTFNTDTKPVDDAPNVPIQVRPVARAIDMVFSQTGTFTGSSTEGPLNGTFTIAVTTTFDFVSRAARGQMRLTMLTEDQTIVNDLSFDLANQIATTTEFPDSIRAGVSGRVTLDQNGDGIRQIEETGLSGIRVDLVDLSTSNDVLNETTFTNATGHYALYNLPEGRFGIRLSGLPRVLDFGTFGGDLDANAGSDVDSRSGVVRDIQLATDTHQLHIDAGLRQTPHEFTNPNIRSDVNNDGQTTAGDALAIINLLSRLVSGQSNADLTIDRMPGEFFYDVDRNGVGSAADALEVIFALSRESLLGSSGTEQPVVTNWVDDHLRRRRTIFG